MCRILAAAFACAALLTIPATTLAAGSLSTSQATSAATHNARSFENYFNATSTNGFLWGGKSNCNHGSVSATRFVCVEGWGVNVPGSSDTIVLTQPVRVTLTNGQVSVLKFGQSCMDDQTSGQTQGKC
jgi:hypothetical protein